MAKQFAFGSCQCCGGQTSDICPDANGTLIATFEQTMNDFPLPVDRTLEGCFIPMLHPPDDPIFNPQSEFSQFSLNRHIKLGACLRVTVEMHFLRDLSIIVGFPPPIIIHGDDNLQPNTYITQPFFQTYGEIESFPGPPPKGADFRTVYPATITYVTERFKPYKFNDVPSPPPTGRLYANPGDTFEYIIKAPKSVNPLSPPLGDGTPRPMALLFDTQPKWLNPGFKTIVKIYAIGDVFAPGTPPEWY
jgi:hypothetical protein